MGKRIGLFGGSFDPPHLGHLALALDILEAHRLDEIWFCPAYRTPFKASGCWADASHRWNMVQCVIASIPGFLALDFELRRKAPSYTVDTLRECRAREGHLGEGNQWFLLLGSDAALSFFRWHQPAEIIQLATPLVGSRLDGEGRDRWRELLRASLRTEEEHCLGEALLRGATRTRLFEISSSEIRERVASSRRIEHLVPTSVCRYIAEQGLYRSLREA